ncbi:MAG: hypothetical protein M1150_03330 [Patescibacteria group bacterium]|nr:hypothetical protein [Patescibacteria group bacterium]
MKGRINFDWLVLIQMVIGYEWLQSGWEKIHSGTFASTIGKTLAAFTAAKNPNGWYVDFLKSSAIPNKELFANLTMYGELLVGIALLGGGLLLLFTSLGGYARAYFWVLLAALVGGALMNLNFYFAAGWTSPSTSSVNVIMFLIELILIGFVFKFLTKEELK